MLFQVIRRIGITERVDNLHLLMLNKSNVCLNQLDQNMPKPKSQQKSKNIQRVAAHLFAHKGFHTTSMRGIARELGMNQSSLYHYFKSKEDILFKLMNDAVDDALKRAGDLPGKILVDCTNS